MKTLYRVCLALSLTSSTITAAVSLETVPIGHPGNSGELSQNRTVGSVAYPFRMGKYEVTNDQYMGMLNSVAKSDPYHLFAGLTFDGRSGTPNVGIERTGIDGDYRYSLLDGDDNWRNRPVAGISLWQAMRFANWMHNGQPVGAQDSSTTEDGSYGLHGYTGSNERPQPVLRNANATWVIPSEDEWYKAAYYDAATDSYFEYPTSSNELPTAEIIEPDPGNNVNAEAANELLALGPPYYVTEVGEFENSSSPYGTFDQGGNLWEWTETISFNERILRGGSFDDDDRAIDIMFVGAAFALDERPGEHDLNNGTPGFRLALVPEPTSFGFIIVGTLVLVLTNRRQSRLCRH